MTLVSKLVVVWDLFVNWLRDTPGLLFSRLTNPAGEEAVPVEIHDNHLHIQMMAPSARPLSMILDTGDSSGLSLHQPFVQKHALLSYVSNGAPHFTSGIAGDASEILGRLESFQLGESCIERPVVAFSQAEKGSTADASYDGAIGGEILRRFRVILDYSRRRMILERNTHFTAPFEVDMSGMDLVAQGPNFKTIQVHRIYENTPAAEAGLRTGDTLLEINGTAAETLGLEQVKQMLKEDGQEYPLSVQRNGQRMQLKLNTRRLV